MVRRFRSIVLLAVTALGVTVIGAAQEDAAGTPAAPEDFVLAGDVETGKALFLQKCAICHGKQGNGKGRIKLEPPPRDLTDGERMGQRSDWQIYVVIREGGKVLGLSSKMFPWKKLLSEQETRDLAAYVRSLSEPAASPTAS